MTAYYDRNFAGMDISATQFSLMMNIKEIGKTNIKDLTNVVKLDKSTLTRTLAPLIEKGFIYSEQGKNRREVKSRRGSPKMDFSAKAGSGFPWRGRRGVGFYE